MGIYSRDYIRESPQRPKHGGSGSVCKWLIIITVVVFVLQNFSSAIQAGLELHPAKTIHGQVWRLITYAFCHSMNDLFHILFNMLFIWWFGKTLETMYGSREFLLFYLTAALVAGVTFVTFGLFTGELIPAVGASGSVLAIMMVFALFFPHQRILLMGIIPIEIRWLVLFYIIYDSMPILGSLLGENVQDGIAHSAHLGGLAFGYVYKKKNIRLEYFLGKLRVPRFDRFFGSRSRIRIHKVPTKSESYDNLDDQVDEILKKFHKSGESSLTDREREILKTASQRYKNR